LGTRCRAVAFRIYDLDRTGDIQPGEVARLLSALLQNNPDIALDDASIQKIVDQASAATPSLAAAGCYRSPAISMPGSFLNFLPRHGASQCVRAAIGRVSSQLCWASCWFHKYVTHP